MNTNPKMFTGVAMHDAMLEVNGNPVPRYQLTGGHGSVQAKLKSIKEDVKASVRCLCTVPPPLMHVRTLKTGYKLCANPGTCEKHHPSCPHYAPSHQLSGRDGYTKEAIVEHEDGSVNVRLDVSLSTLSGKKTDSGNAADTKGSTSGTKRNHVKLLGFFQVLYERAGLHRWYPRMRGKRDTGLVAALLHKQLPEITLARRKGDTAVVVAGRLRYLRSEIKRLCLAGKPKPHRKVIVIGELFEVHAANVVSGESTVSITFIRNKDECRFYCRKRIFDNACRSYLRGIDTTLPFSASEKAPLIVIAVVSLNRKLTPVIDALAFMPVSQYYLPYDSSYEHQISNALVEEDRAFIKPLRYDTIEKTFPDFLLVDTVQITPMEVYGMTGNAAYDARKAIKERHYGENMATHWAWDVATASAPPPFPKKVSSHHQGER